MKEDNNAHNVTVQVKPRVADVMVEDTRRVPHAKEEKDVLIAMETDISVVAHVMDPV